MPQIRARDLRTYIKDYGYEKGMAMALEAVLEERVQDREHLRELTNLVAQCIDQVEKMIHVGDSMKRDVDRIKRIYPHGDTDAEGSF